MGKEHTGDTDLRPQSCSPACVGDYEANRISKSLKLLMVLRTYELLG